MTFSFISINNPSIYVVFLQNKACPRLCYYVSGFGLFYQKCPTLCYYTKWTLIQLLTIGLTGKSALLFL